MFIDVNFLTYDMWKGLADDRTIHMIWR